MNQEPNLKIMTDALNVMLSTKSIAECDRAFEIINSEISKDIASKNKDMQVILDNVKLVQKQSKEILANAEKILTNAKLIADNEKLIDENNKWLSSTVNGNKH